MLCPKCGIEKGIKEYNDMLLCKHCYNIEQTTDAIIKISSAGKITNRDKLKIEKIVEDIYNKGFDDGYWQSIRDDYSI